MRIFTKPLFTFLLILCSFSITHSQIATVRGQASGWLTSNPEQTLVTQVGVRYVPELFFEQRLTDDYLLDAEISANVFAVRNFSSSADESFEGKIKPYRIWLRASTNRFEARVGLQKINFGQAMIFRPLMWFDRIDPRDPLQLTDGVYGLLLRYYFLNNANIWLWGLTGNDGTKGLETEPTPSKSVEYGARVQTPLFTGEAGLTYHHRRADLKRGAPFPNLPGASITPEDRIGLDGKWDLGIGVWLEAVVLRQKVDFPLRKYRRYWTVGADYTFDIGNGLNLLSEYFRSESANDILSSGTGAGFSALSANYPLGLIDNVSAMLYRDWSNRQWYRLLTWRRTYDNWIVYLLGYWNPEQIRLYEHQAGGKSFGGKGLQLMVVFNH